MSIQQGVSKKKTHPPSTQRYLSIAEVREDTIILRDGSLRAVLLVSSVNFALKSPEEQAATVQGYISFLNSLSFSVQIIIQSRRFIIDTYLDDLKQREREQSNDLLRIQMADYRQFITELVSMGEIVSKRFFVVVPYNPVSDRQKSLVTRMSETFSLTKVIKMKEEKFRQFRSSLDRNVAHLKGGLQAIGLNAVELDTQSLIELLYATYNPEVVVSEKAPEMGKMEVEE